MRDVRNKRKRAFHKMPRSVTAIQNYTHTVIGILNNDFILSLTILNIDFIQRGISTVSAHNFRSRLLLFRSYVLNYISHLCFTDSCQFTENGR